MSDTRLPRRHYGRRKGWKLRPHQAGLLENLLPQLLLEPHAGLDPKLYFSAVGSSPPGREEGDAGSGSAPASPRDLDMTDVWLEIGFGAGEHLAWQAQAHREVGLIGAEPFVAGLAKLLAKVETAQLRNVRLYGEDARDVLAALPDRSIGRVFLLFPDPWPKTRHHKRRFVQTETLDELARVMTSGAEFRFATDDPGYLVWALERLVAHPAFAWLAERASDWKTRPYDWPQTRYEAKALAAGRQCTYLRFVRR